jgi:hypothetical protein
MNTSFVTNIILVICAICIGAIVVLLFFVSDDWYAKRENVTGFVLLKKNSYEEKKVNLPHSVVPSAEKDSMVSHRNQQYHLKVSAGYDTLVLKVEEGFYLSKQVGDSLILTRSIGYFTKNISYFIATENY